MVFCAPRAGLQITGFSFEGIVRRYSLFGLVLDRIGLECGVFRGYVDLAYLSEWAREFCIVFFLYILLG